MKKFIDNIVSSKQRKDTLDSQLSLFDQPPAPKDRLSNFEPVLEFLDPVLAQARSKKRDFFFGPDHLIKVNEDYIKAADDFESFFNANELSFKR